MTTEVLINHIKMCRKTTFEETDKLPSVKDKILQFKNIKNLQKHPFVAYSDFEALQPNKETNNKYSHITSSGFGNYKQYNNTIKGKRHKRSGVGLYFNKEYVSYSLGDRGIKTHKDVIEHYVDKLILLAKDCYDKTQNIIKMKKPTDEQIKEYQLATKC